jgi:DNA transformation protein
VDAEAIRDLFAAVGAVSVRRMFGGAGIYADGVMIAIAFDGEVYLKADEHMIAAFAAEGAHPFTYATKDGTRALSKSYWSLPARLYDDPEELADWARKARTTSLAAKSRRSSKPSVSARCRARGRHKG